MQIRTLVGTALVTGAVAVSTLAAAGAASRKVGVFHFIRPTFIAGAIVSGHTVIVHDGVSLRPEGRHATGRRNRVVPLHAQRPAAREDGAGLERAIHRRSR